LTIEAVRERGRYAAPRPSCEKLAVFMTDADLFRGAGDPTHIARRELTAATRAPVPRDFDACRALRARFHALERRWPDAPFWARRASCAERGSEVDAGLEPAAQIA
jgi:hypothetical protein